MPIGKKKYFRRIMIPKLIRRCTFSQLSEVLWIKLALSLFTERFLAKFRHPNKSTFTTIIEFSTIHYKSLVTGIEDE